MTTHSLLAAICTLVMAGALCPAAELYVAPDGNDTNPGTRAAPLKTLEAASDAVRKLKSEQPQLAGGATVWLRGGVYRIRKTFELDERDSGTKDAPIVYRACENERVCLSGGRELDPAAFRPVSDPAVLQRLPEVSRGEVFQVDLKAQGISDFGRMAPRGFGRPYVSAGLEPFFNDQPLRLARWPNQRVVKIGNVLDRGSEPRNGDFSNRGAKFTYDYDRPERWKQAEDTGRDPSQQGSVLRHNFFHHNGGHRGGTCTVYLDDGACGVTAFGNVFYKTPGTAFWINRGHDNVVRNNVFIDAAPGGTVGDAAGMANSVWMTRMQDPLQILRLRKAVDVTQPPYATRYPQLANTFDPAPDLRRSNQICANVSIRSGEFRGPSSDDIRGNYVTQEDPGFADAASMNFQLKPDSVVFTKIPDFQKIPFEKIGLYKDEHRTTVPPRVEDAVATIARPPVRDPKTRQFAASLSKLDMAFALPGQGGWNSFESRPELLLEEAATKPGDSDSQTVAIAAGGDSWAAIWHGVILDPARDIVLQMDAYLPDPLDGSSFFELYLNRGQVSAPAAFGVALVGGVQDTGRGDTVGARRDSAGPRVLAKDSLTPKHWYRLRLLIPANTRKGRLLVQDLTAGEQEPRAAAFAEHAPEAALTAADRWAPELGSLDSLLVRLGGDAHATNILLRN